MSEWVLRLLCHKWKWGRGRIMEGQGAGSDGYPAKFGGGAVKGGMFLWEELGLGAIQA